MIKFSRKHAAILAIAAMVAVGCQSAPEEPEVNEQAQDMARQAIDNARSIINGAEEPCTDTGNAGDLLSQAEAAEAEGNFEDAQALAEQAAEAAEAAQSDCYMDAAADEIEKANTFTNMTADQRSRLSGAESDYDSGNYRDAYEAARALVSELEAATMSYRVERGDSLWGISGKADVYGDPYQWPLIYRANSDQIDDADLIYPDQEFRIHKHPTESDRDQAIEHARTRGAWEIGRMEDSDREYLRNANDM